MIKKKLICKFIVFSLVIIMIIAACNFFFVINISNSLPGLLYLKKEVPEVLKKGQTIMFCPEDDIAKIGSFIGAGHKRKLPFQKCKWVPFLKIVAATEGDFVDADGKGDISINGKIFKGSHITKYQEKLPKFIFKGTVPEGKLLVLTSDSRSYDSRIYGFIDEKSLMNEVFLIF